MSSGSGHPQAELDLGSTKAEPGFGLWSEKWAGRIGLKS